jgi:hypothetical protein
MRPTSRAAFSRMPRPEAVGTFTPATSAQALRLLLPPTRPEEAVCPACTIKRPVPPERHLFTRSPTSGDLTYGTGYGRVSAGGVWPCMNAGLPCDVMVTLAEVSPCAVAVMTLVPE